MIAIYICSKWSDWSDTQTTEAVRYDGNDIYAAACFTDKFVETGENGSWKIRDYAGGTSLPLAPGDYIVKAGGGFQAWSEKEFNDAFEIISIAVPPGATIMEQLDQRGMTVAGLADKIDMSCMSVIRLLYGERDLTPYIATQLEQIFGLSYSFWTSLESIYRIKREGGIATMKCGMQYPALDVSNYIIRYCNAKGRPIKNLELQAVLYFVAGEFFRACGRAVIAEHFAAWQFGPVIPVVYDKFAIRGGNPLRDPDDAPHREINSEDLALITQVVDRCISEPPMELYRRVKNSYPWQKTYDVFGRGG